jgi:hypothetical protein
MNIPGLLNRSEGDTLDFKKDNYRFKNGSKNEKSELLKDILAMANAWKATEAYIVIGVQEVSGKARDVCGVTPELSDSDVQQFVNSKTNRPVAFAIEHAQHEGKQLTVIRVLQNQSRPIFLTEGYGRLKSNVVYIRRGSSTDEASPDEIAEMAKQDVTVSSPDVELRFQITIDAYCFRSEHPLPFEAQEPTYFDGFEIIARNSGTALARHIQGAIELPRGVFFDYLKVEELKGRDILVAIGQTKPIKLEFSNYLREPTHHYLAKPNPLEWKPLLPGRELELFSEKAVPLRHRLHELEVTLKWELAFDNCGIKRGEIRFADIPIVENPS